MDIEKLLIALQRCYGLADASLRELPSEFGRNALVTAAGRRFVLKLAPAGADRAALELENAALGHLAGSGVGSAVPRPVTTLDGEAVAEIGGRLARLLTYLDGTLLSEVPPPRDRTLLRHVGRFLGRLDEALAGFAHPAMHRDLIWRFERAADAAALARDLPAARRDLLAPIFERLAKRVAPLLAYLPASVVHHDANDHNLLVVDGDVGGLLDFGDLIHAPTVSEVAIALAYLLMDEDDVVAAAREVVAGYHAERPLGEAELDVVFDLVRTRLAMSVCHAAHRRASRPENAYLTVSEAPAWRLLERLADVDPGALRQALAEACPRPPTESTALLEARRRTIAPSLSVSYRRPLHIVRGAGPYLFDEDGRAFLDTVNNVNHVGHGHPRVVAAAARQTERLNTNTRYLYRDLAEYARRLVATFPEPLRVCFFTCSGSEANDLALRLARTHTGRHDAVVVEGAYHGSLGSLIEISSYKFLGPGGSGKAAHVHLVPAPDVYRGAYRANDPDPGARYAATVARALEGARAAGREVAAFFCESMLSCGGQIVLPEGYLSEVYRHVRDAGGVCVADEVQVGFGRVGRHFWAFEEHGVVPDVVTLGKPIGNGHPMAAVVTTPEIARSFANGMEYFNTFGGNPVSCAVGLAVLDVIEEEGLQARAFDVGGHLLRRLEALRDRHPLIGDVRGRGLFLGIELVRDRATLEPAAEECSALIEAMKDRGILMSVDGPLHNVLKIKPPMVFSREHADLLVEALDEVLGRHVPSPPDTHQGGLA